jgi:hypothetical protein
MNFNNVVFPKMKIQQNLALKSDLQYFLNEEDERKVRHLRIGYILSF